MKPVKATEQQYARALKKIARQSAHIVDVFADGHVIANPAKMMATLLKYAEDLTPYANRVSAKMIESTIKSVERTLKTQSREISVGLREYLKTNSGQAALQLQKEQVVLIKSLPEEAGLRAQKLAMEAVTGGKRPAEVAAEIDRTEHVTESRAMLIARTESAKAAAVITEERAKSVGATHYIWRTAQDSDVRESHAEMEGEVCAYDDPPIVDGEPLNPGMIYNCFVGSTPFFSISNIKRIIRAGYAGQVVTVRAGGVSFTATPNHPILTMRGWIPAGEIQRGDYLIKTIIRDDKIVNEKDRNHPTFDDVFSALALGSETYSGFEFDFYGDVSNGNVDVIAVDSFLSGNVMPDRFESIGNLPLPFTDGRIVNAGIMRGCNEIVEPLSSSSGDSSAQLICRHGSHADDISRAPVASDNVIPEQNFCDNATANAILFCARQLTQAGYVIPDDSKIGELCLSVVRDSGLAFDSNADGLQFSAEQIGITTDNGGGILEHSPVIYEFARVDDICFGDYFGHVYTLETGSGWYSVTPAGIVSKNCRCYAEPILD